MRCPRCGNENPETNRFCGMCGASLVRTPDAASSSLNAQSSPAASRPATPQIIRPSSGSAAHAPVQPSSHPSAVAPASAKPSDDKTGDHKPSDKQSASRESVPAPDSEPVITGPSFLGLNKPSSHAAGTHSESSLKDARAHLQSSRNVDYLLEDDEQPKHGSGKLLLVVVALALAVGFGYLHWKQGGFDWVTGGERKPAPTAAVPDASTSRVQPESPPSTAPAANAPQSAAGSASTAPAGSTSQPGSASGSAANANASGTPESSSPNAPASAPPQANPSQPASENAAAPNESSPNSTQSPSSQAQPSGSSAPPKNESTTASSASEAQPAPEATTPQPKPHKPSAAVPLDTVTEAERYIYGRGVRQDCDHGLRLLKRAADQSNPKAMISMGTIYSTGTCIPRDLPTAYRWYALALHKEPDNQALQNDLQKLWSEMTQPERQLAIKLSQ